MGSWFEIHRSNVERLKSYVYPDGFKLDSDRYQIGVTFEWRHEHFDTFRAYAHAMEIMASDDVEYLLLAENMDAINAGHYYKFEREADGTISLYSHTPQLLRESASLKYLRLLPKNPFYRRTVYV